MSEMSILWVRQTASVTTMDPPSLVKNSLTLSLSLFWTQERLKMGGTVTLA